MWIVNHSVYFGIKIIAKAACKLGIFARSMASKKIYHRGQICSLRITDMAFEGKGIAKIDNEKGRYVVFIPNTIPGQLVECRMIKVKNAYAEAKLIRILEASELEEAHSYALIPGAPYLSLPIEKQREYKQQTSIELFKRIGKIEEIAQLFDEYIESPRLLHYRNKMEYSFGAVYVEPGENQFLDGFALGFKKRGQWLAVEPLSGDSGMFDEQFENFLPAISTWFQERGHSAWHGKTHEGFCRMLAVRKSFSEDKILVNFVSSATELEGFDVDAFTKLFQDEFGDRLGGLIHTINDDISDRPKASAGERRLLAGTETLMESIHGLKFEISVESFFQTNPASAELLYQKALDYVKEDHPESKPVLMDLFAGTGTISQLLAQAVPEAEVIGVEIVEEAVKDARRSAKANGFEDLKFFAADVGKFLLEHPEYQGRIHTITLDPPRAGIAPKTLRKVIRLGAERIVYISCNPATQARDIQILSEFGYRLKKFSLVDQFPHTAHIESVALFEKVSH